MPKLTHPRLLAIACLALSISAVHGHDHYAAGFLDANSNGQPDAGEPLRFIGPDGTSKIFHLLARRVGQRPVQRCGGYYMLDELPRTLFPADSFSFTAVSDGQYDANTTGHAHTGAYIWMEIVSVSGPPGAKFGYWEENQSFFFDTPTVSFTTNQPTGNHRFVLSEGIDDPAEDPFGHIHGRSWTADKPGDYVVGFRLVDLSTSGPGGGPWHTPSQIYYYRFQAGPSFQHTVTPGAGGSRVITWKSQMGYWTGDASQTGVSFAVKRATSLAPSNWTTIGTVVGTTADTATFTDLTPPAGNCFYRLEYLWSTP